MTQTLILTLITATASFFLGRLLADRKKGQGSQVGSVATPDALGVGPDPGGALPGVLGYRRVGGKVNLSVKYGDATYIVIVIAGHPVTAVPGVYLNNALVGIDGSGNVTTTPWASGANYSMNVRIYTGGQTTADATLVAQLINWTSSHIGREITYAIVRIDPNVNPTAFADTYSGGIPDFSFDVLGGKCYDPRNGAHDIDDPDTWTLSTNASIIEANYLIHILGGGEPTSRIDWVSVEAAADIDDESVTLANGGTERRYASSLYWVTNERHEDILERLGLAHAGGLRFRGSKWVMTTGAMPASTATLLPDDYAGNGLTFSETPPLSGRASGVRGQFRSPLHNWELRDYPIYQSASDLAEDDGHEEWLELNLECVSSPSQAQRLARIAYNKARHGSPASVDVQFKHFDTISDDIITLTDEFAGLTAKTYRVVSDIVGADMSITFQLEAEETSYYAWTAGSDEAEFIAEPVVGGETGSSRPHGMVVIDTFAGDPDYTVNVVIYAPPNLPSGASNYALTSPSGVLWTGALTSTASGRTGSDVASSLNLQALTLAIRDSSNAVLTSIFLDTGANVNASGKVEASSPYYILPAPTQPLVEQIFSGGAVLTSEASGLRSQQIELWSNTVSTFGSATLVDTQTNGSASFLVTGATGTFKFYWARAKNTTGPVFGPESNPLLVVFS